jgi:tetratricopeptide (TPR) repeat protein
MRAIEHSAESLAILYFTPATDTSVAVPPDKCKQPGTKERAKAVLGPQGYAWREPRLCASGKDGDELITGVGERMTNLAKLGKIVLVALLVCVPAVLLAQAAGQLTTTTQSKEALALYERAREYVENVENESARPLLDEAIQKDPAFAMAYALRAGTGGGFALARQDRDKAASLAEKASAGERHWIMAQQASADGEVPKIKEHLDALLALHPADMHVLHFAGNLTRAFDDDQALQYFTRATTIDPAFAAPHNQIGYIHISKGDYTRAEQALKQYVATRPERPNPYDSYAELLLRMGRFDESIAQYNKALAKDRQFVASLIGIGHNYVFKGDYGKARETYARASDLARTAPDRASAQLWTAVSYVHEGKASDALSALDRQRAIATKQGLIPNAVGTHLDAALILANSGKTADARKHLDQAWTLTEGAQLPARTKNNLQRQIVMDRALVAAQAKDLSTATAEADKAKALITSDMAPAISQSYEGLLGMIALAQGDATVASQHFEKADPEDVYTMFYRAEAMRISGGAEGAATLYKKVATWNLNSVGYALVRAKARKLSGS